ncbi:MAG: hypothetical protein L3J02_04435 [Henriciella sp.]|nr:hypothetical protein [Henriciella sp.]
MRHHAPRQPRNIINDHGNGRGFSGMLIQERKHGLHLRTVNQAARYAFFKEALRNAIALGFGIGFTAQGLRGQAIALIDLLPGADAGIDHSLREDRFIRWV